MAENTFIYLYDHFMYLQTEWILDLYNHHSVHYRSFCFGGWSGELNLLKKFQKKRRLDKISIFREELLEKRHMTCFWRGLQFYIKNLLKSEIIKEKKVHEPFSLKMYIRSAKTWFLQVCMLCFNVCFAFMFAHMYTFIWYQTCTSSEHLKIEFHFRCSKNDLTEFTFTLVTLSQKYLIFG